MAICRMKNRAEEKEKEKEDIIKMIPNPMAWATQRWLD
jgi:hypothetical protein